MKEKHSSLVAYFRNFIFGVEDSLVSTVGLLSGVAIAQLSRSEIFLIGIVLIFVEAFSMAAGSFLSEYSAEGYVRRREVLVHGPLVAGTIMFFSYFISGFIPLAPYVFLSVGQAFTVSIVLSLTALFGLGIVGARLSGTSLVRSAIRMLVIGGVAIGIGAFVGQLVQTVRLNGV